jgi:hypothetical protein
MRKMRDGCAVMLAACIAGAQAQPTLRLEPTPASECLQATDPQQPVPAYPFVEYKNDTPGRVLVELRFDGPARRPAVAVVDSSGGDAFVDAVKEHARSLRVPCMAPDAQPVLLRREYVFKPLNQKVDASPAQEAGAERRQALLACIKNSNAGVPAYPSRALRAQLQGRVIAQLTYTSPTEAPQVQLLHRPAAEDLTPTLRPWIAGYRLPCFVPGQDEPLRATALFVFRLEGDAYGFKPLTLLQFLGNTTNLGLRPLVVDTTTMACPFDLRLVYRQPALRNLVYSVGPYVAEREPLLEWLRGAALDLKPPSLDSIYGDTADIAVPCVRLNVQPKEKS